MPLTCSGPLSGQHQWTAWAEPDPDVLQYPVMAAALRHVVRTSGWKLDDVVVWVDLFSIPQANRKLQILAINTIATYCATAHAFIICAPTTVHKDTNKGCDTASYQRRMWCRCEQLCHALRNGTERMWVATNTSQCQPLGTLGLDWLKPLLRVFEGDVTVEEDKLSIVAPILGLYAELYSHFSHSKHISMLEQLAQPMVKPMARAVSTSKRKLSKLSHHASARESKNRPTTVEAMTKQSSPDNLDEVTVSQSSSLPEAPVAVRPLPWGRRPTTQSSSRTPRNQLTITTSFEASASTDKRTTERTTASSTGANTARTRKRSVRPLPALASPHLAVIPPEEAHTSIRCRRSWAQISGMCARASRTTR